MQDFLSIFPIFLMFLSIFLVWIDAKKIDSPYFGGPGKWVILLIVFWIVAFPAYLVKRRKIIDENTETAFPTAAGWLLYLVIIGMIVVGQYGDEIESEYRQLLMQQRTAQAPVEPYMPSSLLQRDEAVVSPSVIEPYPENAKGCRYEGRVVRGQPNGFGEIRCHQRKILYRGGFLEGRPDGQGSYKINSESDDLDFFLDFSGFYRNGLPNGPGELVLGLGDNGVKMELSGRFNNHYLPVYGVEGKFSVLGRVLYQGEFNANLEMHGKGVFYKLEDGTVEYSGEFHCGVPKIMEGLTKCSAKEPKQLTDWRDQFEFGLASSSLFSNSNDAAKLMEKEEAHTRSETARNNLPSARDDSAMIESPSLRTSPSDVQSALNSCYPAASKKKKEVGKVVANITISSSGDMIDMEITKSSGFSRLDEAAECVFGLLEFNPGTRDGLPVQSQATMPIIFRLD